MEVQEIIDKLAEVESRKLFLQERVKQAINEAKRAQDMLDEFEAEIYETRKFINEEVKLN